MRKVFIDIYHLPQYNFFKNVILQLSPKEVDIYCVNRGKLYTVIKHELPDYHVSYIGDYKHNKGRFSMTFKIILPRLFGLFMRISRRKYKVVLTSHYQANFIAKLKGIDNYSFIDDPRRFVFPILKFSTNELYLPPFRGDYPNTKVFNALKEWAYLSPKYFKPSIDILREYDLNPHTYIFIREVSTKTSNYLDQVEDGILSISKHFPPEWRVVLSLENKKRASLYPKEWILLEEPLDDIHSLLYYSRIVISTGDSMAREGSILGVQSIYAGIRDMPANQIMIDKNMLWKVPLQEVVPMLEKVLEKDKIVETQIQFREQLYKDWDDITAIVLSKIHNAKNKSQLVSQ